eukprot:6214093-Pleurochrysis_carterae.AAC.3
MFAQLSSIAARVSEHLQVSCDGLWGPEADALVQQKKEHSNDCNNSQANDVSHHCKGQEEEEPVNQHARFEVDTKTFEDSVRGTDPKHKQYGNNATNSYRGRGCPCGGAAGWHTRAARTQRRECLEASRGSFCTL